MTLSAALTWFARHEIRLAWREAMAMMTAGRRLRKRSTVIWLAVFAALMLEVLHVDAPTKGGAVVDDDLRRRQIADHASVGGDLDALLGGDVADEHAADARRLDA